MLILVSRSGFFSGLWAGYTRCIPCSLVFVYYGRGRVSQLAIRLYGGYIWLIFYRGLYREELMDTVFIGTRVDGSLNATTLYVLRRLIGLLAQRVSLSLSVSAASEAAIFRYANGCARSATLCNLKCVSRFRARANVKLIKARAVRNFLPQRALRQGLRVRASNFLGCGFWRALISVGSVISVGGKGLRVYLYGLQLAIYARVLIARTTNSLRVPIVTKYRRGLLRRLQEL